MSDVFGDDFPCCAPKVPYYSDDFVTLFHGDCRGILPTLDKADLLLTDPPYGIGGIWKGGKGHGWGKAQADGTVRNDWDSKAPDESTIRLLLDSARDAVIWGGN